MHGTGWLAAVLLLLPVASGCASADATVATVANEFYASLAAGQTDVACDLLAPRTKAELEQAAGKGCTQALAAEHLTATTPIQGTRVYGTMAQVRFGGETAFLSRFQGGWKVMAAGCSPQQPDQSYDCLLSGG